MIYMVVTAEDSEQPSLGHGFEDQTPGPHNVDYFNAPFIWIKTSNKNFNHALMHALYVIQ